MNLKVKEVLTNLKNFDFDALGNYKMDKREAEKLIDGLRWIPVSERLPEENGVYIVSYEDSVRLLEWFNGKWFFYPSNPAREETGTIIAWMPLPEPYKSESEDKE